MSVNSSRDVFFRTIYDQVKNGEDIVIVSADLGAPSLDLFRKDYPERFVNVGIAEQNLISVACGIALTGKSVIAYAANPFPIYRSYDQIRNAAVLMHIPITILGLGTGFSVSECGSTHFATEDVSIIRTLPGMNIITISDEKIAEAAARITTSLNKPRYLRFDRQVETGLYENEIIDFGKGFEVIWSGNEQAVIASGYLTTIVKTILDSNFDIKNNLSLIDVFSLPVNEKLFLKEMEKYKKIITVEEHVLPGGLGSMVLEILNDNSIYKEIKRFGLNFKDAFPRFYGNRQYLLNNYGLRLEDIKEEIEKILSC